MYTSSEPDAHLLKKRRFLIDSTAFHGPWVTGAAQAQNWANTPSCKQQLPPRVPEWLLLPCHPLSCTCFRHRISNTLLSVVLTLSVVEDHPPLLSAAKGCVCLVTLPWCTHPMSVTTPTLAYTLQPEKLLTYTLGCQAGDNAKMA